MDKLSDFISRIFSTDRTQGLSGGAEVVIDRDPASAFYASRLRKHRSEEDLVETPTWLWATVSYNGRKGGLRSHVAAERGEGIASFTDVLVVLNQADARRAAQVEGEPWTERAARAISEKFSNYCAKERFELLYGTRPLRFWFVADGGQDMLGHSFGLGPGEFITGLLPNLYVGPAPRSRPVLAVHLHLPGAWEGYREVGRLYSDQILFTLGRHWLDNFHHPRLREPGLYRLQQFPDGSLVHVISPELQDRYFVRSDALEGGASVLTIAERSGNPVAYLVLAVIETPAVAEPGMTVGVPLAALRSQGLSTEVEVRVEEDEPAMPARATTPLAAPESAMRRDLLQRTIIPDAIETRMLTLHERGALLQKVHFANFMDGYDVYVGSGGRVATQMASPRATLQVRGPRVSLAIVEDGVRVDGKVMKAGTTLPLSGTVDLEIDGHALQYRDLTTVRVDGWPYLGELRRPGAGTYLDFGGVFRVGRDRRCQVRLPDEPHNDNITWLPQVGTGTTIRSRTGDIPKSRFYTDSIMVASEHAELDLASEPVLRSLARHCYTYVRRDGEILPLAPREGDGRHQVELRPNDEVLVGNCLFQVAYPPVGGQMSTMSQPPPPAARPSAGELASLVDLPDQPTDGSRPAIDMPRTPKPTPVVDAPARTEPRLIDEQRVETAPDLNPRLPPRIEEPPKIKPSTTFDPAVAGGLGEPGPAPRPPRLRNEAPPPGMREAPAAARHGAGPLAEGPTTVDPVQPKKPKSAASLPDLAEPPPGPARLGMAGARAPGTTPPDNSMFARPALQPPPPQKPNAAPPPQKPSLTPPPAQKPGAKPPPPMLIEDPLPVDRPHEEVEGAEVGDPILAVEEQRWKLEMARPARLVQVGWMVSSEIVVGNHATAQVVVPEVRAFPEQAFLTLDYFRISVRGRRGRVELLQEGEATLTVNGAPVSHTEDIENARLSIVRRDENLEPDFDIDLKLRRDEDLPDPRAQLVEIDVSDRLVAALFTIGFPLRADRRLRIGRIELTVRYDGSTLRIMDYLGTYKIDRTFLPFYHGAAGRTWKTMPEDGAPVDLHPNDGLLIGNAVYRFQAS